jgi:hypothetical protein
VHGGGEKCKRYLIFGNSDENSTFGKPRYGWDCNIKMDIRGIGLRNVDCVFIWLGI